MIYLTIFHSFGFGEHFFINNFYICEGASKTRHACRADFIFKIFSIHVTLRILQVYAYEISYHYLVKHSEIRSIIPLTHYL